MPKGQLVLNPDFTLDHQLLNHGVRRHITKVIPRIFVRSGALPRERKRLILWQGYPSGARRVSSVVGVPARGVHCAVVLSKIYRLSCARVQMLLFLKKVTWRPVALGALLGFLPVLVWPQQKHSRKNNPGHSQNQAMVRVGPVNGVCYDRIAMGERRRGGNQSHGHFTSSA